MNMRNILTLSCLILLYFQLKATLFKRGQDRSFINKEFFNVTFYKNPSQSIHLMHIPKTSGKSFGTDLRNRDFYISTWESSWKEISPQKIATPFIVTLVRNPTSHVVSMHQHCQKSGGYGYPDSFKKVSLSSWVNYWDHFKRTFNDSIEKQHYDEYVILGDVKGLLPHEPFFCYIPINLQSTRLGIFNLTSMRERVNSIFHIGIKDMYIESLCVLQFKARSKTPDECKCGNHMDVTHIRHGVDQYDYKKMLDFDIINGINSITRLDQALYMMSKERLISEIRFIQQEHDQNFLCDIY